MTPPRAIVHLTSEMAPLVKVGGLGDMVPSLAWEQARRGHAVTVVLPAYRDLGVPEDWSREALGAAEVPWGLSKEAASFERLRPPGVNGAGAGIEVLLVRHDGPRAFFERPGVYDDPARGQGYSDNAERFLFFCRAAIEALAHRGQPPDILHAHDHQAAWALCFARTHEAERFRRTATVFTLHNVGYQGIHDAFVLGLARFGRELFYPASPFEYWGRVNYMKVGISFADKLTTVSPRYAEEIRSSEEFGFGLEGLLTRRAADLHGVLNGIDVGEWNPATDPRLPENYNAKDLAGKRACRKALLDAAGLPHDRDLPIIGMVTRLAEQKGIDLIEQGANLGFEMNARFIVLGSGEPRYELFFHRLAEANADRVYVRHAFDDPFAHLITAGADMFLMPSRYEPCGLNQMYAMRYGTPPVVRAVGGLADTVEEYDEASGAGTGFLFRAYTPHDMLAALRRATLALRQTERWERIQRNGMARDFSWAASASRYETVYDEALARILSGHVPTLESVRAGG